MAKKRSVVVVGVGTFGKTVIQQVNENSSLEIIAIDKDEEKLNQVSKIVDGGYIGDCTQDNFFNEIGLNGTETFIISISDNIQDSVLITSIIKKNYPKASILAKAANDNHRDILESIGADEIISTDVSAGKRVATKVINPNLTSGKLTENLFDLEGGLSILRIPALEEFIQKKVMDIDIPSNIAINIIFRKNKPSIVNGSTLIKKDDEVVFIGKTKDIYSFAKKIKQD